MTARKTAAAPAKRTRRKPAAKPAKAPQGLPATSHDPQSEPVDPSPLQQYVEPPPVQRYDDADMHGDAGYYDEYATDPLDRAPSLRGCLLPVLIGGVFVALLAIIGILLADRGGRTPDASPSPVVNPVNAPLAALIEPIRVKLAGDRAKAAIVADAYTGLEAALRGKSGERVTGSQVFAAASTAYLTDVDARGGVAVGKEIDTAIAGHLGMTRSDDPKDPGYDPIQFDASHRAKLIEVVAAIADTAEALR